MKREDLGKMLEANLGWPVLSSGGSYEYQKLIDDELQDGAEGFWNDMIDALCADIETRKESIWFMAFDPEADGMDTYFADFLCGHLRRMKIGDGE